MKNFFLYKYNYLEGEGSQIKSTSATIIFCDKIDIDKDKLKQEIRQFYEENYQTDKIFIIGGEYLKAKMVEVFIDEQDATFRGIPKRQDTTLNDSIHILTFNKNGELKNEHKKAAKHFLKTFLNEGLQNIFIARGGLITSNGAHHFVFPSGKHCDKFLRTGNILLYSCEIYFIAFALLKHFQEEFHDQIYCDTSSINSVAFSLIELKNRFLEPDKKVQVSIESFSSYSGLYEKQFTYGRNAFLLISASTSSNIIKYILTNHKIINRENIVIMFYLGSDENFVNIQDKVLCNLTKSIKNTNGIQIYTTYKEADCIHCKDGSYAVKVSGDVFLLENPKVNRITLRLSDAEKNLSTVVEQFKSIQKKETVLKVNYKYNSSDKYDIYVDYSEIIKGLSGNRFEKYKLKLESFINQYIPSNTKYILSLNDKTSEELSQYILTKISDNYAIEKQPIIVTQDSINTIKNVSGTVVVVGSCISNGKNLLYISRALRKFDNLKIVYFIGIARTRNREYLNFLKTNLKQGFYGADTNSFIEVDCIYCDNNSKNSAWLKEQNFLNKFIDFIKDEVPAASNTLSFLNARKKLLQESGGELIKGLTQQLFYPTVSGNSFIELSIRKNFAFFDFDNYSEDVTQSDIYFTISNVINSLRNNEKNNRVLNQTAFVRNLIDPANFSRFNDGIIQACVLRASYNEELAYSIDSSLSQEMYDTLETLIKYYKDEQGEALLEFLYALASGKMSLEKIHLERLINLITKHCDEEMIKCFNTYIEKNILNKV